MDHDEDRASGCSRFLSSTPARPPARSNTAAERVRGKAHRIALQTLMKGLCGEIELRSTT